MPGKAIIILLAGIISIAGITVSNILDRGNDLTTASVSAYNASKVKNIAEAGVQMALRKVTVDTAWRTGFPLMNVMGGKVSVRLKDTTAFSMNLIKIEAFAFTDYNTSNQKNYTAACFVDRNASITTILPPAIKGAISANNSIQTLGSLQVDGRDHNLAGVLIPNSGTLGVYTTSTLNQSGSSDIGGTKGGIDYSPSKPANVNTIATLQTYPGGYPTSPDSIMGGPSNGYTEGKLKAMAMSGVGGSQYVTNPALLTYPLKGVTYVELPSGGSWSPANIDGSGILVVHNTALNAEMKNVNSGTFKGVLIADDIIHIHNTIIGAVISMSPLPSAGNCIGNGSGEILYSSEAIRNATNAGTGGGNSLVSSSMKVVYWWEQ
ncbi:hypothetical protein MASR1M107_12830 [Ignavibacteriales bacterium]